MTDVDKSARRSACSAALRIDVTANRDDTSLRYRVHLGGELDVATVGLLADAVGDLPDDRPELVVIDLSELRFVDARGLRAFLDIHRHLHATGSRLVLALPTPHVARILALTAVDTEITVRLREPEPACPRSPALG